MDQELKQRLIGAVVVTALAAIFIPMLFDDPIDTSGQAVSEMTIPEPPPGQQNSTSAKLPADAASIENAPAPGSLNGDSQIPGATAPPASAQNAADSERVEPELQESPIDYEPPVEVDPTIEKQLDEAAEGKPITTLDKKPDNIDADDSDAALAPDEPIESAPPAKAATPGTAPTEIKKQPALSETRKTPQKPSTAQVKAPAKSEIESKPVLQKSTAAAKAGTSFERWYVQAGFFSKKENALAQLEKLRKLGLPAILEPQDTAKGTRYRLKVGPELSKQRAVDIKSRLTQQNISSIIVTE